MQITTELLVKHNACRDEIDWFKSCGETLLEPVIEKLLSEDRYDWANWLVTRLMGGDDLVRYTIFAAERVIHLYESEYPDDARPRNAIEAAKIHLVEKTPESAARIADLAALVARAASSAALVASAGGLETMRAIIEYGVMLINGSE